MSKWYYEDIFDLKNPKTNKTLQVYVQANGVAGEDFEIFELKTYDEEGNTIELTSLQEDQIVEFLENNEELRQQAYERSIDDAHDIYGDR
jgi:hypothetical protein